jgi:hypothetical protein
MTDDIIITPPPPPLEAALADNIVSSILLPPPPRTHTTTLRIHPTPCPPSIPTQVVYHGSYLSPIGGIPEMRDDFRQQGDLDGEEDDEEHDDSSRRRGEKSKTTKQPTDTVATIEKVKSNWLKDALRPPTTTTATGNTVDDTDIHMQDVWNGKNKVPAWYQSVSCPPRSARFFPDRRATLC